MRVIADYKGGTYTFVPTEEGEQDTLLQIASTVNPGDKLVYGGREDEEDDPRFTIVYLHAGSTSEEQVTEGKGWVTSRKVEVGGVKIVLRGSTENDKLAVNDIRNMCYFVLSGVIFLGTVETEGKVALLVTGVQCKLCNGHVIGMSAASRVCEACSEKCEHTYEHTIVTRMEFQTFGMGDACSKCGVLKPKEDGEVQPSIARQHVEFELETGARIFYTNTPLSPSEIVALESASQNSENGD